MKINFESPLNPKEFTIHEIGYHIPFWIAEPDSNMWMKISNGVVCLNSLTCRYFTFEDFREDRCLIPIPGKITIEFGS